MTDVAKAQALVVGSSPINCVVISRVVERFGIRVSSVAPRQATERLTREEPAIVILDLQPSDGDCAELFEQLRAMRSRTSRSLPAVLLLSTTNTVPGTVEAGPVVDMVVARPVTIDRLQPAIEALRARNGDYSAPRA
ncbi:response regulator [Nitratireductor mangrovi]|uniref:Response regulator n=1 Tax=Nitratireductor mangrovi TaxID=2599600 RepID=A0A5B8L1V8_9HYPH|nr:response regulator [Nitratireductor mangrovi]QDZ01652.1 response regulator [Nitratireductor mangrovi]